MLQIQLQDMTEVASLNSNGLSRNGELKHADQAALKMCAVKLVDIRKIQELENSSIISEENPAEVPGEDGGFDGDQETLQARVKRRSVSKTKNRRATAEVQPEDETCDHGSDSGDFISSSKTSRFDGDQQSLEAQLKVCLVKLVDCGKILSRKATVEGESSRPSSDQDQTIERHFPRRVKFLKSFYAIRLSDKHTVLSKGEMVYQCNQCSKSFSSSLDFGRHQNVHVEENSHSCARCGKKFAQRSQLRRHQRVHTGAMPY